jgi:small subunit ribosomal protein S2
MEKLTKKERLHLDRELQKLEKNLPGVKEMARLPGVVFMVDPKKEHIALAEAQRLRIPVVAITDTNCDPEGIDFIIPANDDAIRAIKLFTERIADACLEGNRLYQEKLVNKPTDDKPEPRPVRPASEARPSNLRVEVLTKKKPEELAAEDEQAGENKDAE